MGETTHGLRLARTCLFVSVPAAYGVLALALGMDANWDLRNYHYYNAYAFLSGRLGFDLLLAHVPTFFNPTIDVPFFLAAEAWPARVVGFLLGAAQGLNVIPLFGIAYALLRLEARWRIGTAAGLALLGVTGVGALSLVGTTFYDNVVSLGPLLGLWLVVARLRAGEAAPVGPVVALAAGAIAGLAVGLKPTVAPFALGLSAGMLVLSGSPWRRASLALSCGAGVLLGALVTAGHWMVVLWQSYGNPVFPFFNQLFRSPHALAEDYRHVFYLPDTLWERLVFPVVFTLDPFSAADVPFRDHRVLAAFVLVPAGALIALARALRGKAAPPPIAEPAPRRFVLAAMAAAYVVWVALFCIYRYLIPLEMLAPLVIVLALDAFPGRRALKLATAASVLAIVVLTMRPTDWGRVPWTEKWVAAEVPPLARPERTIVLVTGAEPLSFLVPSFPPAVRFLRIYGRFAGPSEGFERTMRETVARHDGDLYALFIPNDAGTALTSVARFGLAIAWPGCRPVMSTIGYMPYDLCPLAREGDARP